MDYHPDFVAKILRQQATIEKLKRVERDLDMRIASDSVHIMAEPHEADLELWADPNA